MPRSKFCEGGACAGTIFALETVNEPALYEEDEHGPGIRWFARRVVPTIQRIVSTLGLPNLEVVLQYTGSDAEEFAAFVKDDISLWNRSFVSFDFHQYYAWDHGVYRPGSDTVTWGQAASEVLDGQWNQFAQYYARNHSIIPYVGEWSLAINGDQVTLPSAAENNLFDGSLTPQGRSSDNRPAILHNFRAQKCNWMRTAAEGDFYWSARMGSGWDPRPDRCPGGKPVVDLKTVMDPQFGTDKCQVETHSRYDKSTAAFRFRVWNFFEVLRELNISSVQMDC